MRPPRRWAAGAVALSLSVQLPLGSTSALAARHVDGQVGVEYIGGVSGSVAAEVALRTEGHAHIANTLHRPDDLFVSRLDGRIVRVDLTTNAFSTFVELPGVEPGGFHGLLGIAFHPEYASNGKLYAHMSVDVTGDSASHHTTMIREFTLDDPLGDSPSVAGTRDILSWRQPGYDHNGTMIGFRPGEPNILWVSSGDGLNGTPPDHDPFRHGQDPTTLLSTIMRIDVSGSGAGPYGNYSIPSDNPNTTGAPEFADWAPEVWAIGVRSPWGATFDRQTGDFVFGDVGSTTRDHHSSRERVYFERAGSPGGRNYGWRIYEGTYCGAQDPGDECGDPTDPDFPYTFPIHEYVYGGGYGMGDSPPLLGRSVTGGYVYRGPVEALRGKYVFGDWSSRQVWAMQIDRDAGGGRGKLVPGSLTNLSDALERPREGTEWVPDAEQFIPFGLGVAGFGEDAAGNLYFVEVGGRLFKIVDPAGPES